MGGVVDAPGGRVGSERETSWAWRLGVKNLGLGCSRARWARRGGEREAGSQYPIFNIQISNVQVNSLGRISHEGREGRKEVRGLAMASWRSWRAWRETKIGS